MEELSADVVIIGGGSLIHVVHIALAVQTECAHGFTMTQTSETPVLQCLTIKYPCSAELQSAPAVLKF